MIPLRPPTIKLTQAQLDSLAGEYREPNGHAIETIFRQGDQLFEKHAGGAVNALEAESPDTFFRPGDTTGAHNIRLTFERDAQGRVTAFTSTTAVTRSAGRRLPERVRGRSGVRDRGPGLVLDRRRGILWQRASPGVRIGFGGGQVTLDPLDQDVAGVVSPDNPEVGIETVTILIDMEASTAAPGTDLNLSALDSRSQSKNCIVRDQRPGPPVS